WRPRGALTAVAVRNPREAAAALARALPRKRVVPIDGLPPGARPEDSAGGPSATVLVGDPDGWQRQWGLWTRSRADGAVLIATSCAAEFRALAGSREFPPYAHDHGDRAWLVDPGGRARRVTAPLGEAC
ncbi:MAG: hypothetical protein QM611_00105, partial [Microbacterium sp.]